MNATTRYFHGGPSGIWPGRILPPAVTGIPSSAAYGAEDVCRTDRVYVTTSFDAAMMFAALAPAERVSLYQVVPVGDLEQDADCMVGGLSFACRAARIIREVPLSSRMRAAIQSALAAS